MFILKIQKSIFYQLIIFLSLIFFSFFPVFTLEIFQIVTLSQNVERVQIDRSKEEIKYATNIIRLLILDDANRLDLLSENYNIKEFLFNNGSDLYFNSVKDTILHFLNNTNLSITQDKLKNSNHVLEVGVDLIENIMPDTDDYSNVRLKRLITIYFNDQTGKYIAKGEENILEEQNYYPYSQIKSFYPAKICYTSSIRKRINFMTGQTILDDNNEPIPVNIHTRVIQTKNNKFIGLLYSVNSAIPILNVIDDLSDPDKPAILTNHAGTVFYSNRTIAFINVTGYYESILNTSVETTIVNRNGYEGEIIVYHQIFIDIDQNQTILIAKVLPRSLFFRILQDTIWEIILIFMIVIILVALFAFLATRLLTIYIKQISQV